MMEKAVFINGVLALSNSPIANEEIEEIYWGMWRKSLKGLFHCIEKDTFSLLTIQNITVMKKNNTFVAYFCIDLFTKDVWTSPFF